MIVGQKVFILQAKFIKHLRNNHTGTITAIDGSYIFVRPKGFRHEMECYECELKLVPYIVQIRNPKINRYVKIDRATGTIISTKKSIGKYKNIPIARKNI